MSVGFIIFEIIDKDSLLGIHLNIKVLTPCSPQALKHRKLDIHLNIKALTPCSAIINVKLSLDIHLKIKALTPRKSEYDEFQLFITKIK